MRPLTTYLLLLLTLFLAACNPPDQPATPSPTGTAVPPVETESPTAAPTTEITETAVPPTAAPPTSTPPLLETATSPATAEPTIQPVETRPIPTQAPNAPWLPLNIFLSLLGPTPAPEGWEVIPCEGSGPFLCVLEGTELVGSAKLSVTSLDNHPDFQAILEAQGLTPGEIPGAEDEAAVRAALEALGMLYLDVIEADRAITYPDDTFTPLEFVPISMGQLPGLALGFVRTNATGGVEERYLSYVSFDGTAIYWLTAPYDPNNVITFQTDEALLAYEPFLLQTAEGVQLPLPVLDTEVTSVNVVSGDLFPTAAYGEGLIPGEPAAQNEPYEVTGISRDGRWWQVACSEALAGVCWLPADPDRVQPQ